VLLIAVIGITSLAAFWLYIDRVCFAILADSIQKDLGLSEANKGDVLGAFFFTYALFQIPMGSLADRYGARIVLAVSIVAWSLVTAATGLAESFLALVVFRLLLGVTESGAYPAAAGLVRNWAPVYLRGVCSSAVALGGRIGGAAAPFMTAWLALQLVGVGPSVWHGNPSGVNWRGVFVLYGLCGIIVATLFWLVVRDRPQNVASAEAVAAARPREPFVAKLALLAKSRNMQLYGAMQFGVNLGWVFLITLLPTYLNQVHDVPLEERGRMQSTALFIGIAGMILGGGFTDLLRAWLGPRLGRSLPLGISLGGCALAVFLAPNLPSAWAIIIALGVMAFLVDMHNPTVWSFAQDVGGRHVGAALGWGNMWGNLGAALSPVLLARISREYGWDMVFTVCGASFVVAAFCGLLLDARRPLEEGVLQPNGQPASR
jgi:sugar phosphate permease